MKSFFCCIVGLFFISISNAQSLWEAGYFIDNNGKRTEALINKRLWRDNPTEFKWKKTISSTPRVAKIDDIKEFSVGEDHLYKRYILQFDINGDTLGKSTKYEDPNLTYQKVFLRWIVRSETSLFQYSKNEVSRFFYTNDDTIYPELLVYKVYYTPDDSKDLGKKIVPKENTEFREQLNEKATCGTLDTSKLSYTQTDLKRYFIRYNECKNNEISYIIRKKINQTRIGLIAAANLTKISHLPNAGLGLEEPVSYSNDIVLRYGIFIETFIPFSKVDLSFFLETTYLNYSNQGTLSNKGSEDINYNIDYKSLNLAFAPRIHIYLTPKFELFLEGGISIDFNLGTTLIDSDNRQYDLQNTTTNYFYGGGFGSGRFKIGYRMYTIKDISNDKSILPAVEFHPSSVYLSFTIFGHRNKGG